MRLLERIVAHLPWCSSVCLSVCLVPACIVIMRCNLAQQFVVEMLWAPWHQSMSTYSQPSFSSFTWKRGGVWMCKLAWYLKNGWRYRGSVRLLLIANGKSYMPRRLAQQRMTLTDLEYRFKHRALSLRELSFSSVVVITGYICLCAELIGHWRRPPVVVGASSGYRANFMIHHVLREGSDVDPCACGSSCIAGAWPFTCACMRIGPSKCVC